MEYDKLLRQAAETVVQNQSSSISLVRRDLKISLLRSSEIIKQLEALGIVGSFKGEEGRDVKTKTFTHMGQILSALDLPD